LANASSGTQIGPAMQHEEGVGGALLFKDERRILSWSDNNALRLWDVGTGKPIGPDMRNESEVQGALLFKDESRILSWSGDFTVGIGALRLWDVATGKRIGPAMHHGLMVRGRAPVQGREPHSVVVSGQYLATPG
jgi:WD40 repeat protein